MTYAYKIVHNLTGTGSSDTSMTLDRGDSIEPRTLMQCILSYIEGCNSNDAEQMIAVANDLYGGEKGSKPCTWQEGFHAYRLVLVRKSELEMEANSLDRIVIGEDGSCLTERQRIVNQLIQELKENYGVSNENCIKYKDTNKHETRRLHCIEYEDHEVIVENDMNDTNEHETSCHEEPLRRRFRACIDSNEVLNYFGLYEC